MGAIPRRNSFQDPKVKEKQTRIRQYFQHLIFQSKYRDLYTPIDPYVKNKNKEEFHHNENENHAISLLNNPSSSSTINSNLEETAISDGTNVPKSGKTSTNILESWVNHLQHKKIFQT